jgi:DHA1 family inner membrane transport protein
VLLVYGAGGVLGTALGGRLADLALFRSLVGSLVFLGILLAVVALISPWAPGLFVGVFLVSIGASTLAVCLQMRLMETAGDAQMLGAALNHSALNLANALGAWLGGLVIAAGLGYRMPSVVGAGLAAAGLVPLALSAMLRRPVPGGPVPVEPDARRGAERVPAADRCNPAANVARDGPRAGEGQSALNARCFFLNPKGRSPGFGRCKPGLTVVQDRIRRVGGMTGAHLRAEG